MSLQEKKSPVKQPAGAFPPSSVVQLNVGGHLFSTTLSTLRKYPESKLAELFSGLGRLHTDGQGNYFIDRDGSHFGAVLDFLRSEQLPTQNIQEVHKEAIYYNLKPLIKHLEESPHLVERHGNLIRDIENKFLSVVQLNVGGYRFSTTLSTLRKHPDSKLAELFSNQGKLHTDGQGCYFIDRDGSHFGAILNFLRTEQLPTKNIQEVYKEAVHYNIKPLIRQLEETPQLFGELVGRQHFISKVPNYKENVEVLIRIARAEAIGTRYSNIIICILQTEEDLGLYENAINSLEMNKESVVTFGPCKAVLSVKDLLDCVKMDIESQGYKISIQPHIMEKSFLSKRYDFFYNLTCTWW